jgi:hypothetical protein
MRYIYIISIYDSISRIDVIYKNKYIPILTESSHLIEWLILFLIFTFILRRSKYNFQYFFSQRMMESMEVQFLANVEASPSYRQLVIGMAEEAAERNVI